MSTDLQLNFSNGTEYSEKVEITIRLKNAMSSADYKTVSDAANTILSHCGKYISKPKEVVKK